MKSRETLIRLKKFQVDEKRRKVAQIETMIAEFERMAADLEREIKVEQDRAGVHDPAPLCLSDLRQGGDRPAGETRIFRGVILENDVEVDFVNESSPLIVMGTICATSWGTESSRAHALVRKSTLPRARCPFRSRHAERCRTCAGPDTT